MEWLKILLVSIGLMSFVFLALGIKLLFDKKAQFTAGCSGSANLKEKGIGCGCGEHECERKYYN